MDTTGSASPIGRSTFNVQRSTLKELTWDNPVLIKEFRTRMRGARAYWVLLVYVLLLTLVVGSTYLTWYFSTTAGGISRQAASGTGRLLYQLLFSFQAGMVALITPAITAGAITIEREQQTYQMLATCGLRPRHIIFGKLMAAVAFVALLLTSSLPLVSLSFLLGGVSPGEVFGTYVSLALSAFVFGSIGILCSSMLRVTAAATVATYAAVLVLFVGTLVLGVTGSGTDLPFRAVNAATAIYHAVDQEPFFGMKLPSWLVGVTMNLLMGLLFANLAMSKLEYFEDRRPFAVRGLATLLWAVFQLFLIGNLFGQPTASWAGSAGSSREFAGYTLAVCFGMLLGVLPIFTSGEAPAREQWSTDPSRSTDAAAPARHYLRGLLPTGMFRADLGSGLPLLSLWLAITSALVFGGSLFMGRADRFPVLNLPLALFSFVAIAGLAALVNWLSVTFRDRRAALVLGYLIVAAFSLLPLFGYMSWDASARAGGVSFSWQFLYLNPFMAFTEQAEGSSFWNSHPPMLFGRAPFWLVTGVTYAGMAVLFFWLTLRRVARADA